MAHRVYTKTSSGWKRVPKISLKDPTEWAKIKKGWVKVSDVSADNNWKLFFAGGFPAGIILPYYSTGAIPNDWQEYSAPYGRSIFGADAAYPPRTYGGISSIYHEGKVATSGLHGGEAYHWNASFVGDGDCRYCIRYDGDNHHGYNTGQHVHSNIGGTVSTVPPKTELRLIKAVNAAADLPVRVGVFSNVDLPNPDLSELSAASTFHGRYFSGDTNPGHQDGAATHLSPGVYTSYAGSHHHGGANRTLWTSQTGEYAVFAGNHKHLGYAKSYTNNYSYHYLSMWYSASDIVEASPHMIGMWEGTMAPEGWAICDGTNGTPDLRNKFIKFANSGDRSSAGGEPKVGLTTFTDTNGSHTHRPSSPNSNGAATDLYIKHHSAVGHFHESTQAKKTLLPPYYSLTFIMKLPED